ncbi:MAG: transposase [Planctomycetota bacterium]|jgi:putative transposase
MPRVARVVVPGCWHHVTQRGNNRQDVFFVDDDRRVYLELLGAQGERFGLAVQGYCLMSNHVHLIVRPRTQQALARAVGRTHWLYTQYVNRMHGRSGHLWQNRFYSCGLDDEHFWTALAYVERNPVRAKLVRRAWRYVWSSAVAHCGGRDKSGLLDLNAWRELLPRGGDWREALVRPQEAQAVAKLRLSTSRGRPLGSDKFVAKLERSLGRRLRPLPIGRPPKKRKK